MTWQSDYEDLARLLAQAATQFEQDTGRTPHQLDFEYKKIAPTGELVVKQIRQIPSSSSDAVDRRFLAGGSINLSVFQGEHAEVLASHRLKSNWQLTAGSRWLVSEDLSVCLYEDAVFEYQDEGQIWTLSGSLTSWPEAQHEVVTAESDQGFEMTDSWTFDHLENPRRYKLTSSFAANRVVPDNCPVLFLSDLAYALEAEYTEPVLDWGWNGELTSTATDQVSLVPVRLPGPDDLLQTRTMEDAAVTIETSFYWPPAPTGPTAGYTAPLIRWVQTTITGLTAVPFTLTGDYSQTYEPGHHNFYESFLFEPRLEPGLSQETLDELRAQGIDLIVVSAPRSGDATVATYDLTDTLSPGDSVVEEGQ